MAIIAKESAWQFHVLQEMQIGPRFPIPDDLQPIIQSKICRVVVVGVVIEGVQILDYDNDNDFFDSLFKICGVSD